MFQTLSYGHLESSSDNPAEKMPQGGKFSADCPKILKSVNTPEKIQKIFCTIEGSFDERVEIFLAEPPYFFAQSQNGMTEGIFSE